MSIPLLTLADSMAGSTPMAVTDIHENLAAGAAEGVTTVSSEAGFQKQFGYLTFPLTDSCLISQVELSAVKLFGEVDKKLGKAIILTNSDSDASWLCGIACCIAIYMLLM
jgi:hypothetical protein